MLEQYNHLDKLWVEKGREELGSLWTQPKPFSAMVMMMIMMMMLVDHRFGGGDVGVDEPKPYSAKQQVLMRRRQVKRLRRRKRCRFLEMLHSLPS